MTQPTVTSPPSSLDSDYHKPRTVEDVTERNVQTIAKLEEAAKANRSHANRLADKVASFCGSMTFVWVHVIWFGGCVILNLLPRLEHFDPFPFTFLTFVVSLEAIFLLHPDQPESSNAAQRAAKPPGPADQSAHRTRKHQHAEDVGAHCRQSRREHRR